MRRRLLPSGSVLLGLHRRGRQPPAAARPVRAVHARGCSNIPFPAALQNDRIAATAKNDERRLNKLGYKQELQRKLSYFHNFGVAISFLSPITGLTGEPRSAADQHTS